jgi:hypothetical protein
MLGERAFVPRLEVSSGSIVIRIRESIAFSKMPRCRYNLLENALS